jgi:hypothetical protein
MDRLSAQAVTGTEAGNPLAQSPFLVPQALGFGLACSELG